MLDLAILAILLIGLLIGLKRGFILQTGSYDRVYCSLHRRICILRRSCSQFEIMDSVSNDG